MKRQFEKCLQRIAALTLGVILSLGTGQVVLAEDNVGTGDVAGVSAALADSAIFALFSSGTLQLVKTAFMTSDQSPLTSGDTLPAGTNVDFMIYVNNQSDLLVADVSIQDVLDALFVYTAGTIRVDNSVAECAIAACDAAEELAIYNAARVTAALTDGVDGDTASIAGVTIDVGNQNVANGPLDAAANSVLAVVFTVQVQ